MKERPILFTGAMVRALLAGDKTQTRRITKPQPADDIAPATFPNRDSQGWRSSLRHAHGSSTAHFCPYGQPGDRLWVRETWGVVSNTWDGGGEMADWAPDRPAKAIREMRFGQGYYSGHAIFAADGSFTWAGDDDGGGEPRSAWHPSIHMPRAASRILLEVTAVRVERLNDISCADARAEGAETHLYECYDFDYKVAPELANYRRIWESLYGAGSWDANPWVWVVEFRSITS